MAEDEEYELLPRHEIENLKKELERLKKNPLGDLKEGQNLLDGITTLNSNIKRLIDIFSKADADMAKDYADRNPIESLASIKDQNEQIAQGLLAVADLVKDIKDNQNAAPEQKPQPQSNFGPSGFGQEMNNNYPGQIPSPPPPPFDMPNNNMPNQFDSFPPPPSSNKRRLR